MNTSATHWLYPISANSDYYIVDATTGKEVDASIANLQANIASDIAYESSWLLSSGFRTMVPGDLVWMYAAGHQWLGAMGQARQVYLDEDYDWRVLIGFDHDASTSLAAKPIERTTFAAPQSPQRANTATTALLDSWLRRQGISPHVSILEDSEEASAEDARRRVIAEIVRRQGQQAFRRKLLDRYNFCAVSGESATPVLEAAHIEPYLGPKSNSISNGILLRSDLHTLFDLHLIGVDPNDRLVVSATLAASGYGLMHGTGLWEFQDDGARPSAKKLADHLARVVLQGPVLH